VTLRLAPALGIAVAGSGVARAKAYSNEDAWRVRLGERWRDELAQREWSADRPREAWGVESREWIEPPADAASLAEAAARAALADAGRDGASVDLLVVATSTPPRITSSLAGRVGAALGVRGACIDVRAGGAGGLFAWTTAAALGARRALVVAAETPSAYFAEDDLSTSMLFGDGAGALVLERDASHGERGLVLGWMGREDAPGESFTVPGGLPPTRAALEEGRYRLRRGSADYESALGRLRLEIAARLGDAALAAGEVALFLPYAVTSRSARDEAGALGVAPDRLATSLARHGCMGCASVLVALHEARAAGRARAGDLVATTAVAGGVSWAALLGRL